MIPALYEKFQNWCERGSVYMISDTHFDDDDCIKMCSNWPDAGTIVAQIKKIVHKNDTLIHLGDVGNVEYIKQLRGYKVLIMGNHDSGASNYKRKIVKAVYSQDEYTREEAIADMKKKHPNCIIWANEDYEFRSPFLRWNVYADNCLFDEVYEGPLMIGEKILLSHEPILGLDWCLNIHGHDHSGRKIDDCHLNLASNVRNFEVFSLGEYIKHYGFSKIKSLHRDTIDRATQKKQHKNKNKF